MALPIRWRYKLERWRDSLGRMFRSEPQPARPQLCPACGRLVGSTAKKCHECGASLTFSLAAASRSLSRLIPATAPVTYGILVLSCLLYGLSLLASLRLGHSLIPQGSGLRSLFSIGGIDPDVLILLGGSLPLRVDWTQPWRLVTAVFLHGSFIHIGFNMWVLVDFGPTVEEVYGSARYLFLYVLTGIAGFLTSATMGHFSIGASGALMGLIGLMLAITTRRGGAYMQMMRGNLLRWVVSIFVFGLFFPGIGIDNAGHFGGLAAGFLLGRLMADREPATLAERQRAYALGWLAGLVVVASFVFMLLHYFRGS